MADEIKTEKPIFSSQQCTFRSRLGLSPGFLPHPHKVGVTIIPIAWMRKIEAQRTVREEKNSFYTSRFFDWSNNQINTRQVNRREKNKFNYIRMGAPQEYETHSPSGKRLICHPEFRRRGYGVCRCQRSHS